MDSAGLDITRVSFEISSPNKGRAPPTTANDSVNLENAMLESVNGMAEFPTQDVLYNTTVILTDMAREAR